MDFTDYKEVRRTYKKAQMVYTDGLNSITLNFEGKKANIRYKIGSLEVTQFYESNLRGEYNDLVNVVNKKSFPNGFTVKVTVAI